MTRQVFTIVGRGRVGAALAEMGKNDVSIVLFSNKTIFKGNFGLTLFSQRLRT